MKFALIDAAKEEFPVHRLCYVPGISQRGYFAWKGRSACRRQHEDMVLLAISPYIDGFYNPIRRHSALDFTSPAQFEKMAPADPTPLH